MADVKLLEPQRLTDNPDGGGLATSTEIVDGAVNNLFPDISRIDRVNGEVSLRKAFVQATTADTDVFSGVHVIVQQPPADDRVSCVLFRTEGWADERDDARALVERYLDSSVITRYIPYDRQLIGQRALILFARPDLALPEIGEVYVLTNETLDPVTFEFVRVQALEHEVQTFTDGQGDFDVRIITLTITQPLTQEFAGSQPTRYFEAEADASIFRRTIVSDAARYKGITPLAVDADVGALTLKVGSVYAQLAPSAASEAAVTDAEPAGASTILAASDVESSVGGLVDGGGHSHLIVDYTGFSMYLPRSPKPGEVRVVVTSNNGAAEYADNGDGTFTQLPGATGAWATGGGWGKDSAMSIDYTLALFSVDYVQGDVTLGMFFTPVVYYVPSADVSKSSITAQQPITISTRGYVYAQSCNPLPEPGTATVSYMALGKWYTLEDDGAGALEGGTNVGSGSVNYATGTITVSLGALPDIGSSVIFAWGGSSEYEIRTGDSEILPPQVLHTLEAGNCEPSTLTITWESGSVAKSVTDDGEGNLSGDGTGRVVYSTGEVALRPTLLPDPTTTFDYAYQAAAAETELFNPSKSGSTITMTVASAPIRARSLLITYQQGYTSGPITATTTQQLTDNGAGELIDAAGNIKAGSVVNYVTGAISFNPDFTAQTPVLNYERFEQQVPARESDPTAGYFAAIASFGSWPTSCGNEATAIAFVDGSNVTVQYKQDSATDGAETDSVEAPSLLIDLTPNISNSIVPGGVMFSFGGRTYVDRNGVLQYGISATTGAGSTGGSINYSTGLATITSWVGGAATTLTKSALLTQVAALPVAQVTGRTPGAPLRPSSFFIRALRYDTGAQISATADVNGNIDTANMHGYVDVNTGVFSVFFGTYALDSALTADEKAEPWYNALNVDADGYILRPIEIIPGSLKFSCVIQTTLPLDPAIIGINPVRLPLDGRVQMIRPGDTLVIHDTVADTLTNPLSANDVEALSRSAINSVVVYDQEGVAVDPALYEVDLVAGTLTFADPLDLSAYTQPLIASQSIEDMALCTDAQITGDISIAQPLTHGYTAANSYVSSALVVGDCQARVEHLFALNTWTGDWDAESGDGPTSGAQYDDLTYPLVVTNADTITQGWRIQFTSSTAFSVVAEELGIVTTGTTSADVAPINPATGLPYFTLDKDGFGATGWATGNAIRFNTVAAGAPIWVARTTRPGPAEVTDDLAKLQVRWDKD